MEKRCIQKGHPLFFIQNDKSAIWQVVWETKKKLYGEMKIRSIQLAKLLTYRFVWKKDASQKSPLFFIQNDKSAIWQVVWGTKKKMYGEMKIRSIQLAKLLTYRFGWENGDIQINIKNMLFFRKV